MTAAVLLLLTTHRRQFLLKKIQMQTSDKSSWSWYTNCFCMVKVTPIVPPGHYDDLSLSAVIELIGEEIKRVNIGCKLLILVHAKLLFKKVGKLDSLLEAFKPFSNTMIVHERCVRQQGSIIDGQYENWIKIWIRAFKTNQCSIANNLMSICHVMVK